LVERYEKRHLAAQVRSINGLRGIFKFSEILGSTPVIRVPNEWQVLWPSYKKPGHLSDCYLDTMKYFMTVQLGWGSHGGQIKGALSVWKKYMYDYYFRWIRGDGWNRL